MGASRSADLRHSSGIRLRRPVRTPDRCVIIKSPGTGLLFTGSLCLTPFHTLLHAIVWRVTLALSASRVDCGGFAALFAAK